MARTRNIKPGFFHNEDLADCEPLARLLFAALWTIADREGRLEYRPRKIKVECLPYDTCDVAALVKQLSDRGFVSVYQIENSTFLQIVNFQKHQTPHVKEPASTIQAPDKHQTSTSRAEAVSPLTLLPSSLTLNPSSVLRTEADASPERPVDLKAELWKVGKAFLAKNGIDAKQAGSLLGKWRRDHGDHAVIDVLAQAETCAASEVIPYIEKSLRKRGSNGHDRRGPATRLMAAAFGAVEDRERQRESQSDRNAPIPLLGRN